MAGPLNQELQETRDKVTAAAQRVSTKLEEKNLIISEQSARITELIAQVEGQPELVRQLNEANGQIATASGELDLVQEQIDGIAADPSAPPEPEPEG